MLANRQSTLPQSTLTCTADSDLVPAMGWRIQYTVMGSRFFRTKCCSSHSLRCLTRVYTFAQQTTVFVHWKRMLLHTFMPFPPVATSRIDSMHLEPKNFPMDTGGYYFVDPDGGGTGDERFMVFCNMTMYNDNGVTVISHDNENATLVDGYEARGSYSRIVTYTGVNLTQTATLVCISKKCFQFIKFECFGVELFGRDMAWWVSRDGNKMNYRGGADPDSGKCACGMDLSCVDPK